MSARYYYLRDECGFTLLRFKFIADKTQRSFETFSEIRNSYVIYCLSKYFEINYTY